MAGSVDFRLLGPVEAVRNGDSLPLGGRRQRALLALLALERGRPVSRDRLVHELWQGRPPAGSATTLRSYVSRLRKVLGADAAITAGPAGYALEVAADSIDLHRFERLTREGEEALGRRRARQAGECLREALELWRGRPFADLADDGELRVEAERLEELRLLALEGRIEADLALGRSADLVDELEVLVREHPYRERLWRQLMLALYRAERQADALAVYQRAREILDRELGLEPSEKLKQLEQAVLRHEVPAVAPPEKRHNLPARATSFVGREAELADVERLLGDGRLVTLTGVGGVGKTRLALEAADHAVPDFPDGVFFVDFAPLADPALVVRHVAAELDVGEQPNTLVDEQLATRFRDTELLLVLDNCEHLREACSELVRSLLQACPLLRILATSREVLGVAGEVDLPVPPLSLPQPDADQAELRDSEAVRLFVARASESRSSLRETDSVFEAATRICRDLDGLPLAIELAAARAKALSLEEIAARLADRFRFLVSWRRLTAARHRTLREAMDWSYELLSQEERELLARLSVFAGGFTLAAAASVCLDGDDDRALELVGRLVDASLVVAEERGGEMRYRFLETVRQYAAERLDETAGRDDTHKAHACFFVEFAESAQIRGAEQRRGLAQLDADLDNLRAALDYTAAAGDAETELRLTGALWRYWWVRGYLAEARGRIEAALARGADVEPSLYTHVLFGAGILAWCVGDYERGRTVATQLLAAADATGSVSDEHAAHKLLSMIMLREGDFAASERHSRRTVSLAEALGSEVDVLVAKLNLAVVVLDSGQIEAAVPMFEDVLAHYRRSGIAEGVGLALLNLGEATYHLGEYARAREHFDEARTAFDSIGFRAHVGHALRGLAAVEASCGSHLEAARLLGRADSVLADVGASEDDFAPSLVAEAEAGARARLGDDGFAAAYDEGRHPKTATA